MACYSITKYGYTTIHDLMIDVVNELTTTVGPTVTAGNFIIGVSYTIVTVGTTDFVTLFGAIANTVGTTFTATGVGTGTGTASITKAAPYFTKKFGTPGSVGITILESTTAVDPLADTATSGLITSQISGAWRLCFNQRSTNELSVHAGTKLQFPDSGTISYLNNRSLSATPTKIEIPGNIGADWTGPTGAPDPTDFNQIWLNRTPDVGSEGAYPMSYTLTITNRGVFFAVWQDSQEEVPQDVVDTAAGYGYSPFRWFLIQRAVDRLTGTVKGNPATLATSRCPVFCLSGSGAPTEYRKFVVREKDVVSPSRKKWASVTSEDSTALINPYIQQSLTESGEFVVTFISNLSTSRYKYSDELDMLGTVSAAVIGAGSEIQVTVYGESTPRTYTALYANMQNGTGMRLMVLTKCSDASEDRNIA